MTYDAVLFDLDGTVWDSAPGIFSSLHATMAEMGRPLEANADLTSMVGPPLATLLARLGIPEEDLTTGIATYRRHYQARGEHECTPYAGIADLLDDLRAAGLPLATATSKGDEPAGRMLAEFDLARRFDAVSAASMESAHSSKVDIMSTALERLGVDPGPRVAMVGDRNFDIDGGNQLGCTTIGAGWGYGDPGELEAAHANIICGTVEELRSVLLDE